MFCSARADHEITILKKNPPPPLETRQFCFPYPFVSVFETQKVLCKKAVRKDKNWFSADLPTPKRQKYWDSEPKAGKSSERYWKVEKVRCIKFPACYKWRIILKLVHWTIISTNLPRRCWLACVAIVKRVSAFLSPLFAPASQATVDMYTVCWRPYWNVRFRFIPMSEPIKWQRQVMVGFHYSSATSWHVCCLTKKRTQQMLQKLLGCGFSRLKERLTGDSSWNRETLRARTDWIHILITPFLGKRSNSYVQTKNQMTRTNLRERHFAASGNFSFYQSTKQSQCFHCFGRPFNHNTKLNLILRGQHGVIMTASCRKSRFHDWKLNLKKTIFSISTSRHLM